MAFVQACSLCLHGVGSFYFILSSHDFLPLLGFRLHFELLLVFFDAQFRRFLNSYWMAESIFASTFILFWFGVFEGHTLFHFHHTVSLYEIPYSFGDLNDGGDSVPARSLGTVQSDILRPARLGAIEWGALLLPVCLLHCSSLCFQWTYPYVSFTVPVSAFNGQVSFRGASG
jgi:hypothetical protein